MADLADPLRSRAEPGGQQGRALQTVAVHGASDAGRVQGACVPPIFQAATFSYDGGDLSYDDVRYTRCNNNPSQLALAAHLAALEGAEAALPVASGMAAISATLLHLLQPGDHILVVKGAYGGTHDLVAAHLARWGVTASRVDPAWEDGPARWEALVQPGVTRLFYVEAISNPLCEVMDLPAVVAFAKKHKLLSIIDATFATPVNLQPARLGFDVVLHSATKYLNGHSDVIAGVVAGRRELVEGIRTTCNILGPAIDPHAAFLVSRGLRTLGLRVQQQNRNALALAQFLSQQRPQVSAVHYPGLKSSRFHARAAALFTAGGCGGVFSFELAGGVAAAEALLRRLALALVAPSLGGVETLVTRPATTSHAGMSAAERAEVGISDGLVRVAVGVEDTADLLADFAQALTAAAAPPAEA
ncbi:MAG: cystathionine beta-lyase MetC [Monoraphidium minutum]|nr:MAG: cystathionine beta-lyase MetC [Monoraphidium minutum]